MELPYHISLLITLSTEANSVLIASMLLFLCCLLQWKNKTNTKEKPPPMPSNSLPIIGHLHLLKGLSHIALGRLADQYGPIFMLKLGFRRALVVSTADMAKECLTGVNDSVFLNRPYNMFVKHLSYNSAMFAFSPHSDYWREVRKIATQELLSNQRVEISKDVTKLEVRSAIKRLSDASRLGSVVDMNQWFSDNSFNIIVRLISGKSLKEYYQGEEYNQVIRAFKDFFELSGALVPGDALPFIRWLDIGGYEKKMKKVAKEIDLVAQRWLEEHKHRRSSKEAQNNRNVLDVMLSIFEEGHEKISIYDTDTIIKATSIVMILGATDTTIITLTWVLSLLLNNKDVIKKAQAELDTMVGKERVMEESDLKNLVYLQAVVKETMRLYPSLPLLLPRQSIKDCIVGGYHIPARTQLFVSLHKIHRDPRVWEDPHVFRPERFLTTDKDYDVRGQTYDFMPFGNGKRICPGISFALQNIHITLANLLHGFEFSLPSSNNQTIDMTGDLGIFNHKTTPLEVMLSRRLPHNLYD